MNKLLINCYVSVNYFMRFRVFWDMGNNREIRWNVGGKMELKVSEVEGSTPIFAAKIE